MVQFCGDESKEEQNHEVYNMASLSFLAHIGLIKLSRVQALRSQFQAP
jgi:hypothetical protein